MHIQVYVQLVHHKLFMVRVRRDLLRKIGEGAAPQGIQPKDGNIAT